MTLPGALFEKLRDALVEAYPTRSALRQMVRIGLDQNLAAITGNGNLTDVTHDLIQWAEAQGRLADLLAAAKAQNPNNQILSQAIEAIRAQNYTPPDTQDDGAPERIIDAPFNAGSSSTETTNRSTDNLPSYDQTTTGMVLTVIGALLLGLIGNIAAGFLQNFFEAGPLRRWLVVTLLVALVLWEIWHKQNHSFVPQPLFRPIPFFFWGSVSMTIMFGLIETGRTIIYPVAPTAIELREPPERLCPADVTRTCILVASFFPADEDAKLFQATMLAEIDQRLGDDPANQIVLKPIERVVQTQDDARSLAQEQGALIVIWGLVKRKNGGTDPKISVYFEITDQLGINADSNARPDRVQPLFYDALGGQCPDCLEDIALHQATLVAQTAVGLAYYAQDRPKEAGEEFLSALACAGMLVDHTMLGLIQLDCVPGNAVNDWNPAFLTYYAGRALSQQGDFRNAEKLLMQVRHLNPNDLAARVGLAALYQRWLLDEQAPQALAQLDEALVHGSKALADTSLDVKGIVDFDLGIINETLGDYNKALAHFKSASGNPPDSYVTLIGIARVQNAIGDKGAAEDALGKAIDLDPNQPWAYLERADVNHDRAWFSQQRTNSILRELDERFPNVPAVHVKHAKICIAWADFDCAQEAYDKAEALLPNDGYLQLLIGDFYRETQPSQPHQDWEIAIQHYKNASERLRPHDPWAHERLGYALSQKKLYTESVAAYDRAIEWAHPDSLDQLCQTRTIIAEKIGPADSVQKNSLCLD